MRNNSSYLTVEDISRQLRVTKMTVYRWINSGKLPALKFANVYRIAKEDYQEFLKQHRKKIE